MAIIFKYSTERSGAIRGWSRLLLGIIFSTLLYHSVQTSSAYLPKPYGITLGWDASASPDVTNYNFYYGTVSGVYSNFLALDNVTNFTVSGLTGGVTYYFAVTAVDTNGLESVFSDEAVYQQALQAAQISLVPLPSGQAVFTVNGWQGHSYDLQATEDLMNWTTIGTVTLDASGTANLQDTNTTYYAQRFFRTKDNQP